MWKRLRSLFGRQEVRNQCACCRGTFSHNESRYESNLYLAYHLIPPLLCRTCIDRERECIQIAHTSHLPELLAVYQMEE